MLDGGQPMADPIATAVQTSAPASRYPELMRAIFAAFAHHGKPLRGLMSTSKSPNFQDRSADPKWTPTINKEGSLTLGSLVNYALGT